MDQKKINRFKNLITNGEFAEASKLIPKILNYDQYIRFCDRSFAYSKKKYGVDKGFLFELASIQALRTREREQELLEAENKYKLAEEEAGFKRTVLEDAEASFDLMSEKAATVYDEDIITLALWELEK